HVMWVPSGCRGKIFKLHSLEFIGVIHSFTAGTHCQQTIIAKTALCLQALALTPEDGWSVHAVAHVHEMKAEMDKGLKFMASTEKDWMVCDMLACHNYWSVHYCAHATNIILTNKELQQVTQPHTEDHTLLFNDLHFFMVSLGSKETTTTQRLLESLQELAKDPAENHQLQIAERVGLPMCQALLEYDQRNYSQAVELLKPIKDRFVEIGGSDAQRDVFNQLLIHAAMKSGDKEHQRFARCMLIERDTVRPNSLLTDRLIQKAQSLHV
uniref:Tetratricopeptide repeat domain 38 n=2 Tax=Sinocyclocheilus grahami TaxID=75366 RepID=A0A672PXV4_SINGR